MKPLETWLYALLLVVTLGFAHQAWQSDGDGDGSSSARDIVVFDPGKAGVSRIHWDGKKSVTTLEVEGRGDAMKPWVTSGKRPKIKGPAVPPVDKEPASADTGAEPAGKAKAGTEKPGDADSGDVARIELAAKEAKPEPVYGDPELRSFPGGKQARELIERFAPLKALRRFEALPDESLADMGLDEPVARLAVEGSGRSLQLEVGAKAYGSSDTYVREPESGVVYLLSSKVLGALRTGSTRLMERNLFDFEAIDAEQATVQHPDGTSSRTFSHEGRHDEANAYWADPANREEVDTAADGFMKKVFQLRATTYAIESDRPDEQAMEPVLRVQFDGSDDRHVELARLRNEQRSKADEPVFDFYARSPITRGQWVKVSRTTGSDLSDALDGLLGG